MIMGIEKILVLHLNLGRKQDYSIGRFTALALDMDLKAYLLLKPQARMISEVLLTVRGGRVC